MLSISGMSGFPQISLPMAHRLGVPLGFSLLGPAGSDRSLIRISQQLMSR
jgi:amidase